MKIFGWRISDVGLKNGRASRAHSSIRNPQSKIRNSSAFTLIELLVVVILITGLMAATLPAISALTRSSRGDAGLNTINVAITVARAYSTRQKLDLSTVNPILPDANYSGTAIVVASSNELRLVENNQTAVSNEASPRALEEVLPPGLNGYSDIPGREYIAMPKHTGVLGIIQTATGMALLSPPFAIRFNKYGQLLVGNDNDPASERTVFYDGDNDGKYQITNANGYTRDNPRGGGTYTPEQWDPESQSYLGDSTVRPDTTLPYKLPFDGLEAVVGVLVYSKLDLQKEFPGQSLGPRITDFSAGSMGAWLMQIDTTSGRLKNARQIFFSRYTGVVMREQ